MAAIPNNSKIKFVEKVPNLFMQSIIEFYASNDTPVHPIVWIGICYSYKIWLFGYTVVIKNAAVPKTYSDKSKITIQPAPRLNEGKAVHSNAKKIEKDFIPYFLA